MSDNIDPQEEAQVEGYEPYIGVVDWSIACLMQRSQSDCYLTIESNDVAAISCYIAVEQLLRSATFSLTGAVLYLGRRMVLWADMPLALIKKYSEKKECHRCYFNTEVKSRTYHYLDDGTFLYGCSPAIQELTIKRDTLLREYGLVLEEVKLPWAVDFWPSPVKMLFLDIDKITQEPTKSKLKAWLGIDKEQESEKQIEDKLEAALKERWEIVKK